MKETIKELLQSLLINDVPTEIKVKAQEILDEEFKEEVRDKFKYYIDDKNYDDRNRSVIKNATKCGFIEHFYVYNNLKDFLDNNYDRIDEIINILKEYVKELEEEENETED